jgi:homoserine O-acetyltransferase
MQIATARGAARRAFLALATVTAVCLAPGLAAAADFPAPREQTGVLKDFRFHTGQVLPELRVNYLTIGAPTGEPVLLLHGTAGNAQTLLGPAFGGELFGAGQPLDAGKYFIIIPDAIGTGKTTKPSDGLRANFPKYNYEDMVDAQYRLVKEVLGIKHLRAIVGNSMGGMHAWVWGVKYPGEMDLLVPMACQPTEMSSRNWMLRRLIVDSIRTDPDWNGGNYTKQPRSAQFASVFFGVATNGGDLAYYKAAPTREKADALLDARLKAPFPMDANDVLFQWESSATTTRRRSSTEDPCARAGHQRRGRRAQPAADRHHGTRDQAPEERPLRAHPGQRPDRRPRHDRQRAVVEGRAGHGPAVAAQALNPAAAPGLVRRTRTGPRGRC